MISINLSVTYLEDDLELRSITLIELCLEDELYMRFEDLGLRNAMLNIKT